MTEPLSTGALDELRTEMDEQSENIARGKSNFAHEPLYPRKQLTGNYADTADEGEV